MPALTLPARDLYLTGYYAVQKAGSAHCLLNHRCYIPRMMLHGLQDSNLYRRFWRPAF